MAAVYGSRADGSAPGDRFFAPIERVVYRLLRVDPRREQRWNVYAIALLGVQLRLVPVDLPAAAVPGLACRSTRRTCRRSPRSARSTSPSVFMTNTNWQWYSGELTMSHLTQMVGPVGAELRVGRRRHGRRRRHHPRHQPPRSAHARQLLGRPHPHDAAHPAAAVVRRRHRCCRSAGSSRTSRAHRRHAGRRRRRRRRRRSRSPAGRWPARSPSSSSARTAAASSTPTRPTRSRTRPAITELHRDLGDPDHPVRPRGRRSAC